MLYCMHMQAPTTCMAPSRHLSVCRHAQVDRQSPSLIQAPDWPQRNPASHLAVDGLGLSARTPHVYVRVLVRTRTRIGSLQKEMLLLLLLLLWREEFILPKVTESSVRSPYTY